MRARAWIVYLAVLLGAAVGYVFTEEGSWFQIGWQVAIGWVAAAAILIGARRNAHGERAVWVCFAVGVWGNSTGILVEAYISHVNPGFGFPSYADLFYLSLYPAAALGLALLIRRRTAQRDWGALVDATTVTAGLGLLAWIFMIRPAASDPSIGLLGHIASVSYPVGDVVLVAMTVRLQLGARDRTPSFWFMSGSLLAFLGGDTAWAVINQIGWEPNLPVQNILKITFLIAYVLFGAAALHPTARQVGGPVRPRPPRLSTALIGLLTLASMIAPVLLIFQVVQHQLTDGLAIAIGCLTLILLVVTRMAQLLRQLEQQSAKVRQLSQTDELTGLANRRAWSVELPRAIEHARRHNTQLSVAMIDLDRFKLFNDTYGHPAGDRLLKSAAAAWAERLRSVDYLARYGGEEFIVLLPGADSAQALAVIDRLREGTPLGQTFSSGVATWDGTETSDELVARADTGLYAAKENGRNRIELAAAREEPVERLAR
jgi:diguanylate cyclase (GGDEF)-like protein